MVRCLQAFLRHGPSKLERSFPGRAERPSWPATGPVRPCYATTRARACRACTTLSGPIRSCRRPASNCLAAGRFQSHRNPSIAANIHGLAGGPSTGRHTASFEPMPGAHASTQRCGAGVAPSTRPLPYCFPDVMRKVRRESSASQDGTYAARVASTRGRTPLKTSLAWLRSRYFNSLL